jgi:hypothetical protein
MDREGTLIEGEGGGEKKSGAHREEDRGGEKDEGKHT